MPFETKSVGLAGHEMMLTERRKRASLPDRVSGTIFNRIVHEKDGIFLERQTHPLDNPKTLDRH